MIRNIREQGAAGDGATNDTKAVQGAIDAVASAGGGTVHCPPGLYRIGTILLKDNVELHLEGGATLVGSPDKDHYTTAHNIPLDKGSNKERVSGAHLIIANGARNIAITGRGTIDGNGRAFFKDTNPAAVNLDIPGWRPGQLIGFFNCSDVLIRDVHIVDSPYWTIWPFGCDRVHIQGITIKNNRRTPNGDGIDIDCCTGVRISDCHIDAGDDCITMRSDAYRLQRPGRGTENVTVTNCTLTTCCCALRLGFTGDGPVRNCTFSNLIMPNTRTGINMLVPGGVYDPGAFHNTHGPIIENIAFSNIQMQTRIALYLWVGMGAAAPGCLRNIRMDNITGTTSRACYIGGAADLPIEDVRISGLDLTVSGEMDDELLQPPEDYPVWDDWNKHGIPHGIYARHVRGLMIHNSRVRWRDIRGTWRHALYAVDVHDLDVFNLTASGATADHAAIEMRECPDASVRECRELTGALSRERL